MTKTRKNIPWRGWEKEKPGTHQKTVMMQKCGKKCFLGPNQTYPICKKNTCRRSGHGVYAAYVRAKQFHKRTIAKRAKKILLHF